MAADQVLTALFNAGLGISVGATALSVGMTFTVGRLVGPLHRVGLVIVMVIVNTVMIPAFAWEIAKLSPMGEQYVPGLVLASLGAGSACSLRAAQVAGRVDMPLAMALVVVLHLVNIVAVPLWAKQVVAGASISARDIVMSLLALVLSPLVVGLLIRFRYAELASHCHWALAKVANLVLVVSLAAGIAGDRSTIETMFASWLVVTAIVIVVVAGALGALSGLVGGGDRRAQVLTTTGFVSSARFASLGLIIIGSQLGGAAAYLGPAITFLLVDLILPRAVAVEIGHRAAVIAARAGQSN